MNDITIREVKCPSCGGKRFKQEIVETYYRYINEKGEVTGYEDDYYHDIDLDVIRCRGCGTDCTDLFDDVDIE